jgi:hypothetical protein
MKEGYFCHAPQKKKEAKKSIYSDSCGRKHRVYCRPQKNTILEQYRILVYQV